MLKKLFTAYLLIFSFYFPAGVLAETSREEKIPAEIEKLRNLRRSQINIFKNREEIKIFLFAENEKVEILDGYYCGGADGDKRYTGNYQLISVKDNKIVSRIDLGEYEFIENTQHDRHYLFVVPEPYEQLVAIYQYASCNHENVEFFRVDEYGFIYRVNFFEKAGTVVTGKLVIGDISVTKENIFFCSYDNVIAYYLCDTYAYNGKNFIQTSEWLGSYFYKPNEKNINIREAKRALYEFLSALAGKNYKKAVYYYGGSYDFLLKLNSDILPNDKPKLFERYCLKNGGKCGMPTDFKDKNNANSSAELKFILKLNDSDARDFQDVIINGKSDFEFRVKRIKGEFKVMDLPPYAPN